MSHYLRLVPILSFFVLSAHAQSHRAPARYRHEESPRAISAAVYGMAGIAHASEPANGRNGIGGQFGGYAEYARHALRPGIDARLAGEGFLNFNLWGGGGGGSADQKLIGPRVSYAIGVFHPYVEGLFGKGDQNDTPIANASGFGPYTQSYSGTAKFGAFGCDFAAESHVHLRAEYMIGSISNHGYPVQSFSTGLVFRFP